jgi:acetyl-CoA acyltransferase 1
MENQNKGLSRLNLLKNQIIASKTSNMNTRKYPLPKSPEDVVIVAYARTPLGKAVKGSFRNTQPEVLSKYAIKGCIDRSGVDPSDVQEIVMGNVLGPGCFNMKIRMSQFLAGLSDKTTFMSVNRLCSSGLQAIMNLAHSITAGQVDCGIAGGVESMSIADMNNLVDPESIPDEAFECEAARNCLIPMGLTSENVSERFGIGRKEQDEFAAESYRKAVEAQKKGLFEKEIVPVKTQIKDKNGELKEIIVTQDEGPKPTSFETLNKLKPAFKKGGCSTGGNSSQVTDGAAAVLLMKRSFAEKKGFKPIGRIVGYSVDGVPPEIMGIGPAAAIPGVLSKTGMTINDIDIFEINEAFASQALYCINKLGIPKEKVNPKGGAIALGHPLGCTGARMICTLFTELERTNKKTGIISMCIGSGMGAACVLEREF